MFKCGFCKTQTAPKVPCNIITVEMREKTYPARPSANDPGGSGHETVKEVYACSSCATQY